MKKGFTLIEVISVIVILGIIGLIAVPIANNITKSSKQKLYHEQIDRVKDACRNFVLENDDYVPSEIEGNIETIDVQKLIDEGYLNESEIIKPTDKSKMDGVITITYSNNEYVYNYVEYVYYAKHGRGLKSADDKNALEERPTNYSTYLRYPILDGELGTPEACFLYKGKDFCLSGKYGYTENKARVMEYFGYDDSWPITKDELYSNKRSVVKTNPANNKISCAALYMKPNDVEVTIQCRNSSVSADITGYFNYYDNGDVYRTEYNSVVTREASKIVCVVSADGKGECCTKNICEYDD